jgi:hypothetical protein
MLVAVAVRIVRSQTWELQLPLVAAAAEAAAQLAAEMQMVAAAAAAAALDGQAQETAAELQPRDREMRVG